MKLKGVKQQVEFIIKWGGHKCPNEIMKLYYGKTPCELCVLDGICDEIMKEEGSEWSNRDIRGKLRVDAAKKVLKMEEFEEILK